MNMQTMTTLLSKIAENRILKTAAARSQARYAALTKAAQQYKTDGWTPANVAEIDRFHVPAYYPQRVAREGTLQEDFASHSGAYSPSYLLVAANALEGPGSALIEARMNADPRYKEWYKAHTESTLDAAKKIVLPFLGPHSGSGRDTSPGLYTPNPLLEQLAAKIYHDGMLTRTGTPKRVSEPAAKR